MNAFLWLSAVEYSLNIKTRAACVFVHGGANFLPLTGDDHIWVRELQSYKVSNTKNLIVRQQATLSTRVIKAKSNKAIKCKLLLSGSKVFFFIWLPQNRSFKHQKSNFAVRVSCNCSSNYAGENGEWRNNPQGPVLFCEV